MQPDPSYLRQHYASLSDEALLAVHRADLVDIAQSILDDELRARKISPRRRASRDATPPDETRAGDPPSSALHSTGDPESDWLDDAIEVYGWAAHGGAEHVPDAALDSRDALEAEALPCELDLFEEAPVADRAPAPTHRWRLLVPANLNLRASGILERDVLNTEFEAGWKAQLEVLSDDELREMSPRLAFCGLYDRLARVNRVYDEELTRRKLK